MLCILFVPSLAGQVLPNRRLWSLPLDAPPVGAPVVAGGVLVIPLHDGRLTAHRLGRGAPVWAAELEATQPLAGDAHRVYVVAGDTIHALAAETGHPQWQVTADGPATAAPLVHAGWAVVAAAGELLAIRASDGVVVWRRTVGTVEFRPALDGDLLVAAAADGRLVALDLPTGSVRWEIALGARPTEPLVIGGRVYVGTDDKWFHTLYASNGRRDWRRSGALLRGRPAADDRHVYYAAMDNMIRALDRGNGSLRWEKGLPYRPAAGPVVLGALVIVPGYVDSLPAFRGADGGAAGQIRFGAALTALPVFAVQTNGAPMVFGLLGSLQDPWTLTLLEASLVPALPLAPLKEVPGEPIGVPQPWIP